MKIRNGFVSNSSSASFVVIWKTSRYKDDPNLNEDKSLIVNRLFEYDPREDVKEYVIKRTSHVGENRFETRFGTYMLNGAYDFSPAAEALLLALYVEQGFTLDSAHVNHDDSGIDFEI